MGVTALIITYFMQRRTWRKPSPNCSSRGRTRSTEGWRTRKVEHADGDAAADHGAEHAGSPTPSRPHPTAEPDPRRRYAHRPPRISLSGPPADDSEPGPPKRCSAKVFAVLVPLAYLGLIVYLMLVRSPPSCRR